ALPFILNVVDLQTSKNLRPESVNYQMPLDILYHSTNPENRPPNIDLTKGKHIIGYLSLTCPHCKIAAQKISLMYRENPGLPIFLVLNGKVGLYEDYVKTYKLEAVPHVLFRGPNEYIKMAGANLPIFYWVNNGMVEQKGNGFQLTLYQISTWLDRK
ncbi:MAG: hypothetical protein JWO03_1371, partial [Bacteroidetes bacterium]|nr:hypothetical protein [Bacteroidota bacterium]